jgi:folate-dependent phosphoribosylglycinamide formyltransferase PurN
MHFIGSGALLYHAVDYTLRIGLAVDGVCCAPGDAAIARIRQRGVAVLESADPNREWPAQLRDRDDGDDDGIVFSINNKILLGESLLSCGARFFNVHAGLVQRYRGIAEVCIFAALCRGEERYGATLHQVLPRQKVDAGPVVAQLEFAIGREDRFAEVLTHSLETCRTIFEENVRSVAAGAYEAVPMAPAKAAFTYRDVAWLAAGADAVHLKRAADLGRYAGFFPELHALVGALQPAAGAGLPPRARSLFSP